MQKYKKLKSCRICDSKKFHCYTDLGNQPFSNSFLKKKQIKEESKFPLKVLLCQKCGLSQLSIIPNHKYIFDKYDYLSSSSKALQNHYNKLTSHIIKKFKLNKNSVVMDIGCNDGVLLNQYPYNFNNLIGVEPSDAYLKIKNKKISIYNSFFNKKLSTKINKDHPKINIITITNVFAHIDNIVNFTVGLKNLLNKKTVIVIEFPYLINMINEGYFDLIYHEHLSYLSLTPLNKLFKQIGLRVFDLDKINFGASGPSLRLYICLNNSIYKNKSIVLNLANYEKEWGVKKLSKYKTFNKKINKNIKKLKKLILNKYKSGAKIGCFSAPAKGNTLLNFLDLDDQVISYVCENNKLKIGKYTPGTHIKIIDDKEYLMKNITYSLLLSWNYKDYFLKNSTFIKKGGRFIIPFPKPRII